MTHAKLFTDQSGRPRGCGVLEFSSIELAKQAVQKMNRQDVRGRRITVQPLGDEERDKFGYVVNKSNTGMGETIIFLRSSFINYYTVISLTRIFNAIFLSVTELGLETAVLIAFGFT